MKKKRVSFISFFLLFLLFILAACTKPNLSSELKSPVLLHPKDKSIVENNTVTLEWKGNHDIYFVMWTDDYLGLMSGFTNPSTSVTGSNRCPLTGLSTGTYWWRVKGQKDQNRTEYSDFFSFSVGSDIPPEKEEESLHELYASNWEGNLVFLSWPECKSAEGMYYEYSVFSSEGAESSPSPSRVNNRQLIEHGTTTSNSATSNLKESNDRFESVVMAKSSSNMQTVVGEGAFYLNEIGENQPPLKPYAPYPAKDSQDVNTSLTLSWKCHDPDGDELFYEVYLAEGSDRFALQGFTNENSFVLEDLENDREYSWKIYADEKNTEENYITKGNIWQFKTALKSLNMIEKVTISPTGTIYDNSVIFEWRINKDYTKSKIEKFQYKRGALGWFDMNPLLTNYYEWSGFPEGDHAFMVRAVDREGNLSAPLVWQFTYKIPEYSITVNSSPTNGGDVKMNDGNWVDSVEKSLDENGWFELDIRRVQGYTFDGWFESGDFLTLSTDYATYATKEMDFIAKFSEAILPELTLVPSGTFMMGDHFYESDWQAPKHEVQLTYEYFIGQYEITNKEFLEFLNDGDAIKGGMGPGGFRVISLSQEDSEIEYVDGVHRLKAEEKANYPVIYVPRYGTVLYHNWLSEKTGCPPAYDSFDHHLQDSAGNDVDDITKVKGFRLPTEAEWEFAARGGPNGNNTKYPGSNTLDEVGWYFQNSDNDVFPLKWGKGTQIVGQKDPNELNTYDMAGNVYEWCLDFYSHDYYENAPYQNPVNLEWARNKVIRGGSWYTDSGQDTSEATGCMVFSRGAFSHHDEHGSFHIGFRVAKTGTAYYTLTAQSSLTRGGDIRLQNGEWTDCSSITDVEKTPVTLEASPANGYRFIGWYENNRLITKDNPYHLVLDDNRNIEGRFHMIGKLKFVNSWGVGGWENVDDGFYYMTYECFKKHIPYIYVSEKTHTPTKAIAVFRLFHDYRNNCQVSVGVGEPGNPEKKLNFSGHRDSFYKDGGWHPYPDNAMVMDITSLLPIKNKTVFLEVFDLDDHPNHRTGEIEAFKIEIYDQYDQNKWGEVSWDPVFTPTVNSTSVYACIHDVTIDLSVNRTGESFLEKHSQPVNQQEIAELKKKTGTTTLENRSSIVIDGHGTGDRPPTEEEWDWLMKHVSFREIENLSLESRAGSVDHTTNRYFPPIGNQGNKGSCGSWASAYYTGTFYNAKRYEWDLSEAVWEGGATGTVDADHDEYIMSPDFVYLQINEGKDEGTSYFDNVHLMNRIGVSSWEKCPYEVNFLSAWPVEAAWRDAPKHRLDWKSDWVFTEKDKYPFYYLLIETDEDVETAKALLSQGYLLSVSVDATLFSALDKEDCFTLENYVDPDMNHTNAIVGYTEGEE